MGCIHESCILTHIVSLVADFVTPVCESAANGMQHGQVMWSHPTKADQDAKHTVMNQLKNEEG
jgi:hypothetical protein